MCMKGTRKQVRVLRPESQRGRPGLGAGVANHARRWPRRTCRTRARIPFRGAPVTSLKKLQNYLAEHDAARIKVARLPCHARFLDRQVAGV